MSPRKKPSAPVVITRDEWLAAFEAANVGTPVSDPDALTIKELAEKYAIGARHMRRKIEVLRRLDQVIQVKKRVINVAGVPFWALAYKLKP